MMVATSRVHPTTFYGRLTPRTQAELRKAGKPRRANAGTVLFGPGFVTYKTLVILKGMATVGRVDGSRRTLLGMYGPGDLLIAEDGANARVATVLTDWFVARQFNAADFSAFIIEHPEALAAYLETVLDRLAESEQRILDTSTLNVARRLARALLDLITRFHNVEIRGTYRFEGLRQVELAQLIGSSTESVEKVLRTWRTRRIVSTGPGSILVTDIRALERIAGYSAPRPPQSTITSLGPVA
jgi:CRP-like cAMP-binding protein